RQSHGASSGGHDPPIVGPRWPLSQGRRRRLWLCGAARSIVGASEIKAGRGIASPPCLGPQKRRSKPMRLQPSYSLLSVVTLSFGVAGSFGVAAGLGCAGVKPSATTTGSGGSGGSNGNGGSGGILPVTPISGSFTCPDFGGTSCASFSTSDEGNFDNGTSGSTSITYPLDHSLFPSNLGPIQVQMSTSGSAARITFQTLASSNVNIQYFGACETAPGSGCSVTIP